MEKRLFLFIVLSFIILYIHSLLLPKKGIKPPHSKEETIQKPIMPVIKEKSPSLPLVSEKMLVFNNGLFSSRLSCKGTIEAFNLLKFNDRQGNPYTIIKDGDTFSMFLEGKEIFPDGFSKGGFVYEKGKFKIIKEYKFSTNSYLSSIKLSFINKTAEQITLPPLFLSLKTSLGNDPELKGEAPFSYLAGKVKRVSKDKECEIPEVIDWVASQDKYFLFVAIPKMRFSCLLFSKDDVKGGFPRYSLKGNEVLVNEVKVYAGPRDYKILKGIGLANLSGLWSLSKPLLFVLNLLYSFVRNYGVAIIILTLLIKIILHPLTRKNFKMMKKMQAIKPYMDKLKEKHKDDQQAFQKEMIRLYKEHNLNPFGGLLPILLQMPIFFALYNTLNKAIQLRGAPFILWIKDLSLKDPYFILPILMGITMLIQQKMTPSQQEESTEKIMLIMPIVMTFIFLNFPSGLVLYWLVQNILTIIEHWFIEKGIEK